MSDTVTTGSSSVTAVLEVGDSQGGGLAAGT